MSKAPIRWLRFTPRRIVRSPRVVEVMKISSPRKPESKRMMIVRRARTMEDVIV